MKRNKQIKRNAHVSMVDNVIYIRLILETFEASLSFKTNEKFDLVAVSFKFNPISPAQWYDGLRMDKLVVAACIWLMILLKRWPRMKINIVASHLYYHEPHLNYDPSRVNYEHALLSPDLPTNMLKFNYIINVFYEPHMSHLWYMRSWHTHTNHPHLS